MKIGTGVKKQGRGARKRAKERRLRERRARKAAQRALYESRRNQGINSKSKRYRQNEKAKKQPKRREIAMLPTLLNGVWVLAPRKTHVGGNCGNDGCRKCSSIWQRRAA